MNERLTVSLVLIGIGFILGAAATNANHTIKHNRKRKRRNAIISTRIKMLCDLCSWGYSTAEKKPAEKNVVPLLSGGMGQTVYKGGIDNMSDDEFRTAVRATRGTAEAAF